MGKNMENGNYSNDGNFTISSGEVEKSVGKFGLGALIASTTGVLAHSTRIGAVPLIAGLTNFTPLVLGTAVLSGAYATVQGICTGYKLIKRGIQRRRNRRK